jgi:hypothetical protein
VVRKKKGRRGMKKNGPDDRGGLFRNGAQVKLIKYKGPHTFLKKVSPPLNSPEVYHLTRK